MLVVDAANVVGSRPTGWWRDRAGAAATLVAAIRAARVEGRIDAPVVVVLEGRARDGVPEGDADGIEVVHARGSGDDAIVEVVAAAPDSAITVVSADRGLTERVRALGAAVLRPSWLNERVF